MIDYSNEIFNTVAVDLRSIYPEIRVVGEYVASPATFPTVARLEFSIRAVPFRQRRNHWPARPVAFIRGRVQG